MKIKELICELEKVTQAKGELFDEYLKYLKHLNPNTIVQVSNGDCEDDGIYAPVRKDGGMDIHKAKPFRIDEPFPDDGHDWIKVGYLPRPVSTP